ncbi:type I 3-dehydroquinate dehydratase [Candidatus Nitrosotenuis cloacae]|jgi:3-dehydroquinate dehydratase-1|uniref:type I 3-dehydroquinate dehydratase n=1 Tax=Candidatus Nitrosotenuis cloacae TaxID=1603555 RepID=UPI00227EB5E6|nr:type I 3-dehydroquinate dehydratase [Candidatus Nitrosotenuis cloacae]
MAYKTCVSIAEDTPKKVLAALQKALKRSDYAEIRFDFLRAEDVPDTIHMAKKYLGRCVCTLRPKSEGGRFEGSEQNRISILKLIAEYNPYLIDIEFSTLSKNKGLLRYVGGTKTQILVSWHDFKKTPRHQELVSKLKQMSRLSKNVKIVTTARSIADPISVMSLYRIKGVNLIAFTMGEVGRISRILCMQFGSPYTYVSLGRPVAPGQFSLAEVKSMFSPQK